MITVHPDKIESTVIKRWESNMMCRYENIQKITLKRKEDMILLVDILPFQVYVRPEDYDAVLSMILDRVKPEIRAKLVES